MSEIIGHCFVVGARHQLRASMSAGWRGSAGQVRRNFRQLSPQDNWKKIHSCPPTGPLDFFSQLSAGKNPGLGAAQARQAGGSDAGQVRPGGAVPSRRMTGTSVLEVSFLAWNL